MVDIADTVADSDNDMNIGNKMEFLYVMMNQKFHLSKYIRKMRNVYLCLNKLI